MENHGLSPFNVRHEISERLPEQSSRSTPFRRRCPQGFSIVPDYIVIMDLTHRVRLWHYTAQGFLGNQKAVTRSESAASCLLGESLGTADLRRDHGHVDPLFPVRFTCLGIHAHSSGAGCIEMWLAQCGGYFAGKAAEGSPDLGARYGLS